MLNIKRTVLGLLSTIFILITLHGQKGSVKSDILFWKQGQLLSFADFKGKSANDDTLLTHHLEQTQTHKLGYIATSINVHYELANGKTTFTIKAAMQRSTSWIRQRDDSLLLKHEQGHFDICEIYARVLRRDIRKATSLTHSKRIYDDVSKAEEAEHVVYDKENTHRLGGITRPWQEKIKLRLQKLEAYKNPVVKLAIGK